MTDLYLKFPDAATAQAALYDGETPLFRNIDVIGVISKPTGDTLVASDGTSYSAVAPIPGWHVNVRLVDGKDGTALEQYAVTPTTPCRIWAQ